MPIYEYKCDRCSSHFELKQSFDDEARAICSICGGEASRLFSPVPIFFKGPGFYVTDSASKERSKFKNQQHKKNNPGCG